VSTYRSGMRGQVFPAWIFGLLAALAIGVALLQYGDRLAWQVRAQNAADSAAMAMVAVQAQDINRMMALQTNLALEESRARQLADGAFFAARETGYCQQLSGGCHPTFDRLVSAFNQSLHRYTNLVLLYHASTRSSTFANWKSDATNLLGDLTTAPLCGTPSGLDCAFTYTVPPDGAGGVGGLARVAYSTFQMDDGYGTYGFGGRLTPRADLVNDPFYPARAQVTVCRTVPPIISNFFGIQPAPWTVVATSAAADHEVLDEWWKPGWMFNPKNGAYVQPVEQFVGPPPSDSAETQPGLNDMYNPSFRGKGSRSYQYDVRKAFELQFSWYAAVPTHPFLTYGTDYTAKC